MSSSAAVTEKPRDASHYLEMFLHLTSMSVFLTVWRNVCWPRCMLPPGEPRWVCRWDRRTDRRKNARNYAFPDAASVTSHMQLINSQYKYILHYVSKTTLLWLAITSTYINRFW